MNTDVCPDRTTLAKLLLGDLPAEQRQPLGEHLMNCAQCAEVAGTISLTDDLTAAIRTRREFEDDDEILAGAIERAKQLNTAVETVESEATVVVNQSSKNEVEEDDRPSSKEKDAISEEDYDFLGPPENPDELGRLGGYRVLGVLGVGGMGVVFRAEDPQLERFVALKAMKPAVAASRSAKDRFLKEAKATASIEHDNIVQIYQVGEDRNIPFIAMQFLRGESLQSRLKREKRLDQQEAVRIGREVAAGLAAAHQRNLIHRDIKPDNIWIEAGTGRAKILDFGLVRNVSEDGGLTQSGMVLGTPRYMAPEQAQGQELDHRCDLFSLGSVLYHLVTGKAPFGGRNLTATLMAVAHTEPAPLESVVPKLHSGLSTLITRLLSKDSEARLQSASEVVSTLAVIEQQLATGNIPQVVVPEQETVITKTSANTVVDAEQVPIIKTDAGGTLRPTRRKTGLWMWGGASLVVLLGVITIVMAKGKVTVTFPKEKSKDVVVNIRDENRVIEVLSRKNDWMVRLDRGKYTVEMAGGEEEFHLRDDRLWVTRFGRSEVFVDFNEIDVGVQFSPSSAQKSRIQQDDYALQFDAEDDYVELPDSLTYDGSHPITLEMYVELSRDQNADILSNTEHSGLALGTWGFLFSQGEKFADYLYASPKQERLSSQKHLHVAGVCDGEHIHLFVDGVKVSTTPIDLDLFKPSRFPFVIGQSPPTTKAEGNYSGLVDEVRISNVARYTENFTPQKRFEPDEQTMALYHFDEGVGDILVDSSGNGHHGEIHGAKWVRVGNDAIERQVAKWVFAQGGEIVVLQDGVRNRLVQNEDILDPFHILQIEVNTEDPIDLAMMGLLSQLRFLETLQIQSPNCSDPRLLAEIAKCRNVKSLVTPNQTPESIPIISGMTGLTNLDLAYAVISDANLDALASLSALSSLSLAQTKVTGTGLAALKELKQLKHLHLGNTPLTGEGLQALEDFPHLEFIDLRNTPLSSEMSQFLRFCPQLTSLTLLQTKIDDSGLEPLKLLENLTVLDLRATGVSEQGINELQEALPSCKIKWDGGTLEPEDKVESEDSPNALRPE